MTDDGIRLDIFAELLQRIGPYRSAVRLHLEDAGLRLDDNLRVGIDAARYDLDGGHNTSDPLSPDDMLALAAWALAKIPSEWSPEDD